MPVIEAAQKHSPTAVFTVGSGVDARPPQPDGLVHPPEGRWSAVSRVSHIRPIATARWILCEMLACNIFRVRGREAVSGASGGIECDEFHPAYLVGRYLALAKRIAEDVQSRGRSIAAPAVADWHRAEEISQDSVSALHAHLNADLRAVERGGRAEKARAYGLALVEITAAICAVASTLPGRLILVSTPYARLQRRLGFEDQWFALA
ncbi:hypothetical protein ACIHDR_47200 [Nocardia sp. NPDC052278]|uniref:hypothetical protein n=1 Tax=unclassified Nocardia TaxID=2637762 RepID=UPI0036799821